MGEPPPRRIQLIVNPISGVPGRSEVLDAVLDILKGAGVEVVVTRTEAAGHATEIAREACRRGLDAVVAMGGDGTVNEVLNGMEAPEVALATIPTGTSNILARDVGIPLDPVAAARVVVGGSRRRIDTGRVNGRRFLMVVGVGWDAHVVKAVTEARRGHMGKRRYLAPIARAVLTYDFPEILVRVDGEATARPANLAFVCNTRNYAAWFTLTPGAAPDDGALDFLLIRGGGPRDYVRWAIGAFTGTLPRYREVDYLTGRTIHIEAERPVPFQVDGDLGGTTPVTVSVEEGALEIIVP